MERSLITVLPRNHRFHLWGLSYRARQSLQIAGLGSRKWRSQGVLDHYDYLVHLLGEDHVGIGTDSVVGTTSASPAPCCCCRTRHRRRHLSQRSRVAGWRLEYRARPYRPRVRRCGDPQNRRPERPQSAPRRHRL